MQYKSASSGEFYWLNTIKWKMILTFVNEWVRSLKKKIQDFTGVWTRDLTMPMQCSNQQSYEATDVGSW